MKSSAQTKTKSSSKVTAHNSKDNAVLQTADHDQKDAFFSFQGRDASFFSSGAAETPPNVQACAQCDAEEKKAKKEKDKETVQRKPAFESDSIQTKLKIGAPDDAYEREADAMADRVVSNQDNKQAQAPTSNTPSVQTKCAKCQAEEEGQKKNGKEKEEVNRKPLADIQKCSKCGGDMEGDKVQKKDSGNGSAGGGDISSKLSARKGGGSALDGGTKGEMESSFGADFSGVRIHNDSEAGTMSQQLGAKAFTHGNDIYFNKGEYNTHSTEGKKLLAHELTHTIQQGASTKRADDTIQREEQEDNELLQTKEDDVVQRAGCGESNPSGEDPPDGQEEPDHEETPADVDTEEGASAEERQEDAPDCDEFAPPPAENIAADAQAQVPTENADPLTSAMDQTSEPAGEAGGGAAGGGEAQEMQSQTAEAQSIETNPDGMGEAASPEVQGDRDEAKSQEEDAASQLAAIQGTIGNLQSGTVSFLPKRFENETENRQYQDKLFKANSMAGNFLSNAAGKVQEFINQGLGLPTEVEGQNAEKQAELESIIQAKRSETKSAFQNEMAAASAKAEAAKGIITGKYLATVGQITVKSILAKASLNAAFEAAKQQIEQKKTLQLGEVNQIYADTDRDFRAVGPRIGRGAVAKGNEKAAEYEGKKTGRKDGFWDGYLTDNRYQARADAARETGGQYSEGLAQEANKQADCAQEGKPKDIETVNTMAAQHLQRLEATHRAAVEAIDTSTTSELGQAEQTKNSLLGTVSSTLSSTLSSLSTQQDAQLQLINDYGIRQSMSIVRDGFKASAAIVSGVVQAAQQLVEFLAQFKAMVEGMEAPEEATLEGIISGFEGDFAASVDTASTQTGASSEATRAGQQTGADQAVQAVTDLADGGIENAHQQGEDFRTSTDQLTQGAIQTFDQQYQNFATQTDGTVTNATTGFNGIVTGLGQAYQTVSQNLRSQFAEKVRQMEEGLQNVLNTQLEAKICEEAEKAAAEVQPWWKTVLKILLVIVVIVVVALVIGPAVIGAVGAAAGALGASAGVASFIGTVVGGALLGAFSGAVMQIGNNLIDGKTWHEGVGNAIITGLVTGAIGGFLGGAGNLLASRLADAGRLGASALMQNSLKFGIEMAFDVAGNVLGDLAMGNPITLEGVLQGAAVGAAVSLSTANLSSFGKLGRGASRLQQRSMAAGEAFGARVGGAVRPRPTIDAPSTRTTDAEGPSSTRRSDEPGGPRQDAEGPSTRPTDDAVDPRVREEIDSLGPMSKETQEMLANNPRLRQALLENPQVAKALKKCASPCFPPDATPEQIGKIGEVMAARGGDDFPYTKEVKEFLNANRGDPDAAIAKLETDFDGTIRPHAEAEARSGREMAESLGYEKPPEGYEWYRGPDGTPQVRNKGGNNGPRMRYDPETRTFNPAAQPVQGTPRADLPPPGSPEHQKWQDFLSGKSNVPCLPPGTQIATPKGNVSIEELKLHEYIWSYDHSLDKVSLAQVTDLFTNWGYYLINIYTAHGMIAATPNHPFWVASENLYIRADGLVPGMLLLRVDGAEVEITKVEKVLTQTTTYNFEAGSYHNYYAGEEGTLYLVHNEDAVAANTSKYADTTAYPSTVYVISDGGKVIYVGQTIQDFSARFDQHISDPNSSIYQYLKENHFPNLGEPGFTLTEMEARRVLTVQKPVDGVPMTPYELTVWEQRYIDLHGGVDALENKVNAITPEKRTMYSQLHNPCG